MPTSSDYTHNLRLEPVNEKGQEQTYKVACDYYTIRRLVGFYPNVIGPVGAYGNTIKAYWTFKDSGSDRMASVWTRSKYYRCKKWMAYGDRSLLEEVFGKKNVKEK